MSELKIFNNETFGNIGTMIDENGEPWFIGVDVAKALGYSNYRDALYRLVDGEDKMRLQIPYSSKLREITFINEPGLYSLIFSSKLPFAKEFKKWVYREVLPSIRKTGGYQLPENSQYIERLSNITAILNDITRLYQNAPTFNDIAQYLGTNPETLTAALKYANCFNPTVRDTNELYHQYKQRWCRTIEIPLTPETLDDENFDMVGITNGVLTGTKYIFKPEAVLEMKTILEAYLNR